MKATILSLATLLATTNAIPSVTPKLLPTTSCVYWPSWINSRPNDLTGSIALVVSSSEDPALENSLAQPFTIPYANQANKRDYLGITLVNSRRFAKEYYRCVDTQFVDYRITPINIAADDRNAHLTKNAADNEGAGWKSYKPEIYRHVIDGKEVDGTFLGAQNRTTWGFSYVSNPDCGNGWYEVRLLDLPVEEGREPTATRPIEFKGFLKVIAF
ncbi:hypothetical protein B0J11DRAFT_230892 [Dendryphion nanum]|uniref:Uncharacterized protein n=1 Tax=Dendryphion nanum TaxID=256645 RepID=A0A9P9IU84_9PLEO|nr:hypothetical protein B0J11DRAFT_230892 [Dendryphion nanum]